MKTRIGMYGIKGKSNDWCVIHYDIKQTGDNKGQEYESDHHYYVSLGACVKHLLNCDIGEDDEITLQVLLENLEVIYKHITVTMNRIERDLTGNQVL